MKTERYVIVDTRGFVGNSLSFWAWDGQGYTCDLRAAGIYTEDEAQAICDNRDTDKKYRYSDLLKLVQHHVDMQDLPNLKEPEWRTFPHIYDRFKVSEP